jgi:ribosome-associated protein
MAGVLESSIMPRTRSAVKTETIEHFAREMGQLLADRRCEDIRLFDVRGQSQVCDYMLVATGTSDRQMKSVAAELHDLGEERGVRSFRSESDAGNTWVVVDFIDLVVHLFEPSHRFYYDLEGLWSEAKLIDWRRSDQKGAQRFDGEIGLGTLGGDEA